MKDFILMIEDDPDDQEITKNTITNLKLDVDIKMVNSAREAFQILHQERPKDYTH